MAYARNKRPFPGELFARLSKSECEGFIELLHYTAESDNVDDVKSVLVRFQHLFPFTRVIGGLARLGPTGTFEGFTNVLNASYPEEWLRLYWQKGYFDVDPVFQTALQKPGTQHWAKTYNTGASEKQQEFIAAAKEFGLGDGITTGSIDSACGIATFCSFASAGPVDAERYLQLIEYFGYHIHLALLRTAPPHSQNLDQCVRELTLREMTILNWMKNGKTNGEIGQILGVTERTVRFHVGSIFSKLDVTSRSQAVATAIEHGLPNVV
ncbi:MAG: LuxR family transcriptional regulator [Nitrospira sp.]|jgi:DNA-binding CsgD family transcriptional regulator|nr:LuxR family transcriptional regulator [Nitrospira sp.]